MKTHLAGIALILIFLVAADSNCQNIPNQGFENWITPGSTEEPEFWITNNAVNSISVSKSTDSHSGNFALKVINNGPSFEGPLLVEKAYPQFKQNNSNSTELQFTDL